VAASFNRVVSPCSNHLSMMVASHCAWHVHNSVHVLSTHCPAVCTLCMRHRPRHRVDHVGSRELPPSILAARGHAPALANHRLLQMALSKAITATANEPLRLPGSKQ
jgi:hypothetical protein